MIKVIVPPVIAEYHFGLIKNALAVGFMIIDHTELLKQIVDVCLVLSAQTEKHSVDTFLIRFIIH